MWNFIIIYPLVLKIDRENLKISAITGRLPVCVYYVKINFKKCITVADHSTRLIVSRRSIHFECRRED